MTKLFDIIREHQAATDATDARIIELLCDYIEQLDEDGDLPPDWNDKLMDQVTSELAVLPGDRSGPLWLTDPRFTKEDQDRIIQTVMEEISDAGVKDLAHSQLEQEPLIEVISYADTDAEDTCRVLFNWNNEVELQELAANMGAAGVNMDDHVDFAMRMGLLDDNGVTDLGREYMERWL